MIIGAQRAGSTSLFRSLSSSKDVRTPLVSFPEPRFLLKSSVFSLASFERQFGLAPGERPRELFVEKSTSYLDFAYLANRAYAWFPRVKILAILRNPIERSLSHYFFSVRNGIETLPIDVAFDLDARGVDRNYSNRVSVNPFLYLRRSLYANYLFPWLARFGPAQMRVVTLEGLVHSVGERNSIYEWLEVQGPKSFPHANQQSTDMPDQDRGVREIRRAFSSFFEESNKELVRAGIDCGSWG